MSTNRENNLLLKTTTFDEELETQSSVTSSTRKVLNSVRKPLVVRQTLTSKLRAERGNQLYYKTKLEQLSVQTLSQDSSGSKESLKLSDKFKKPQTSRAPVLKPIAKLLNSTVKSTAKVNLTSVFNTPAKVYKQNVSFKSMRKTSNDIVESKSVNVNLLKEIKYKSILQRKSEKENLPKDNANITSLEAKYINTNLAKLQKVNINSTAISKHTYDIKTVQNERQSIPSKYKKNMKNNTLQIKPNQNGIPRGAVSMHSKSILTKNVESVKKLPNRTDPTKKPVQYATGINNSIKPKTSVLKNTAESKNKKLNAEIKKVTLKSPIRKSLSAMHFKKVSNLNRNNTIHRAQSLANFTSFKEVLLGVEPIREDHEDSIVFKTPSVAKRRSVAFLTPMSNKKSICSPFPNDREPCPLDLRRRLHLWLEKKGKPLGSYHHLRCFDIQSFAKPVDEENKENVEEHAEDVSSSYKDLSINVKENGETTMQNVDPLMIANAALFDLQKLIQEGYPRDQCEAWLNVIRTKYGELEERPEYWECRAALEEAWGNFTTAVDCYKKAIIKGAEVRNVDECLENLLQKFSVLNISPTKTESVYRVANTVLEAKNVFKSSIISFAIQERSKKRFNSENIIEPSKFVATPVRRSTRSTRSGYVSTPGITIYPTLQELDSPIRNSLGFKANKALH